MGPKDCPLCRGPVKPVLQPPSSMLNPDQFESMTVGDFYCMDCPEDPDRVARTGYRYWFERELARPLTVRVSHPPPDPKDDTVAAFLTRLDLSGVFSWSTLPAGDYSLVRIPDGGKG